MHISQYLDEQKLAQYVREGLVDVRYHPSLPLKLYIHTRRCTYENYWDEITTKCRGLIVDKYGIIIARPFEKFFNVNTSWRPETMVENLPNFSPRVSEKLDGSLGILYTWDGMSYIATKGSFMSEQAQWATKWYHAHVGKTYRNLEGHDRWPRGWTPIFEIIAESVQHHVVHYNGLEELVLIALINDTTGEEADEKTLRYWAAYNGLRSAPEYKKTVSDVLKEDRKNTEGYVLTWSAYKQPPLKIKVKHESFLELQKIVHAATPKAIFEALQAKNTDMLNTWIGQTNEPLGMWVKTWVVRLNFKFAEYLLKAKTVHDHALYAFDNRKDFAAYVREKEPTVASVAFAMLDDKDYKKATWKLVGKEFADELSKPFATEEEE